MKPLTRFAGPDQLLYPNIDGKYVLFEDVKTLINNIERRHKLAMDKLNVSYGPISKVIGTLSGRLISRDESPGSIRQMTEEQIVEQERGCRYMRQVIDKLVPEAESPDKVKFAADVAKLVSYNRAKRMKADGTIQFEDLEL